MGRTITYEIKHTKGKIIPTIRGDDISFHVKVDSKGWLMEDWTVPEVKGTEEYLSELEDEFKKIAEQQVKQFLDKIQHKYKVDVGDFGEQLRIKYPKVWRKFKPDWDKRFSEVPITYDIKVKLEDQGSSTD